jgi:hypothetical protein
MSKTAIARSARSFNNTARQRLAMAEIPQEYAAVSRDIAALLSGSAREVLSDAQVRALENLKRRADKGPPKGKGRR